MKKNDYKPNLVLYTVYYAKAVEYAANATAVRGIMYTTVKFFIFNHQTHHLSSFQLNEEQNKTLQKIHHLSAFQFNEEQKKMLQKIIMTAANISHLCIIFDAIAESRGYCCPK